MINATGDSRPHSALNWNAAATKIADDTATKTPASRVDIAPRGSSRLAVRGLSASWRASARRLNPIAALRAATMQTTIQTSDIQSNGRLRQASSAPVSANGRAKTEWLTRTNERYV